MVTGAHRCGALAPGWADKEGGKKGLDREWARSGAVPLRLWGIHLPAHLVGPAHARLISGPSVGPHADDPYASVERRPWPDLIMLDQ